jgi:hypothetical protein
LIHGLGELRITAVEEEKSHIAHKNGKCSIFLNTYPPYIADAKKVGCFVTLLHPKPYNIRM